MKLHRLSIRDNGRPKDIINLEFRADVLEQAKKHDINNPLLLRLFGLDYGIYYEGSKLRVCVFNGYDLFEEGDDKHSVKKRAGGMIICNCGLIFKRSNENPEDNQFIEHLKKVGEIK